MSGGFCATPLWDLDLTWYSDNPDFTACFHKTVLVYLPAAIFLLLLPLELYLQGHSSRRKIPWTPVNILRLLLAGLLLLVNLVELVVVVGEEALVAVDLTASLVRLVSDAAFLLCLVRNKYMNIN